MIDSADTPSPQPSAAAQPANPPAQVDVPDLRSQDASAGRDRAVHRRASWFYEDLLA